MRHNNYVFLTRVFHSPFPWIQLKTLIPPFLFTLTRLLFDDIAMALSLFNPDHDIVTTLVTYSYHYLKYITFIYTTPVTTLYSIVCLSLSSTL